jgi:5-methylcytosine-specific restriction endonuclease McrA
MRADASFCSEQCNSAAHQVTRKIAKRAARYRGDDVAKRDNLVTREEIARRDNYRCQLCGGKVNMDLRHPNPLAPSIDHVIPLAHHGGNGDHNLQLAHLRCNLSKRARGKPAVMQPQLSPNL